MSLEHIVLAMAAAVVVGVLMVVYHAAKYQIEKHEQVEAQRRAEELRAKRKRHE